MDVALRLSDVTKRYGDFEAVKGLSFSVEKGRICGFLGPNGAGKTSSLRMILGLSDPTEGKIEVLGSTGQKVLDRIGFLPEERGLYRKMNPVDTIVFLAGLKGVKASHARKKAKEMLEAQGLKEFMYKPVQSLSKGMSQKVQLISTLIHEPDLVILDEPFSGLDPVNQQGLEAIIRSLSQAGATVLFSTHVMQHAERLCESVVMMAKGQKVFEGSIDTVKLKAPRFVDIEGLVSEAALLALPSILSVEALGQGRDGPLWRCRLSPDGQALETLKKAFAEGLDLKRFDVKEPSLHEAFIVLTGGAHV